MAAGVGLNCRDCQKPVEPDCKLRADYCPEHFAQRWAFNSHERTPGWLKREAAGAFYTGPLPD